MADLSNTTWRNRRGFHLRVQGQALVLAGVLSLLAACATRSSAPPARVAAQPAAAGFKIDTFVLLDRRLDRAIADNEVPGAVLSVARRGAVVYERAVGSADPLAQPAVPMTRATVFDVASLAKPVATAPVAAMLVCEGTWSGDTRVRGERVGDLLRHATGLPAYLDWNDIESRRGERTAHEALDALLDAGGAPLYRYPATNYSNIGYVLLARAAEDATGASLEDVARARVWQPLGMTHTTFRPAPGTPVARSSRTIDPGRAFDPLADYLLRRAPDRAPGHSGLFSTAGDLSRFAQALITPRTTLPDEWRCIAELLQSPTALARPREDDGHIAFGARVGRTLAFESDTSDPAGTALFHTGYTGSLLWIDPPTGTSIVLLTNTTLTNPRGWDELRVDILRTVRRGLVD